MSAVRAVPISLACSSQPFLFMLPYDVTVELTIQVGSRCRSSHNSYRGKHGDTSHQIYNLQLVRVLHFHTTSPTQLRGVDKDESISNLHAKQTYRGDETVCIARPGVRRLHADLKLKHMQVQLTERSRSHRRSVLLLLCAQFRSRPGKQACIEFYLRGGAE